jgi:hypothetical protein
MFQSTDAEVPRGGLSALMTHGHVSFGSPSTRLLCLRDYSRSLQTRWASRLATSYVARAPCSRVLISVPLNSIEKG